MSGKKPSNWYEMDYSAQREWERADRERQNLEYDADRAKEDAERSTRMAREAQADARRIRENANEQAEIDAETIADLESRLDDALTDLANTTNERNNAWFIVGELKNALAPFVKWFDTTTPHEERAKFLADYLQAAREAIAKAERIHEQ
jgi:biopolymer transport protein ExbB/TolQ